MAVIPIASKDQFEVLIRLPRLSVIHFYAEWANQCDAMAKVLETEALNYKEASFFQLPAEDLPEVSLQYNISAVPTFLLFSSGQLVDRINGADTPQLTLKIREQLAKESSSNGPPSATPAQDSTTEDADLRLKRLTHAAPVMLFMKGNAVEPRCGFSKQIVAILDELQAEYKTFDILSDEDVRQGLKRFSNWPTYPQLYVRGELVGGLDIVREMHEAGELAPMLPKKQGLQGLQDRLQRLVKEDDCMVFMKGNRETPKCGFSRQLMEILKETGIPFKTFDILEDEEVRQGLKSFSNWPTYPQVYVKGELIGGLDIIKELKDSGELVSSLQGQS